MRRKDLSTVVLDDYFEKVSAYTKEAVRTAYVTTTNVMDFLFKFWFWWLQDGSESKTEKTVKVEIEKEKEIFSKLKKNKTVLKFLNRNSKEIPYNIDELDIDLPVEKINKFNLFIKTTQKENIGENVEICLFINNEKKYVLDGKIVKGHVIKLHEFYKYDITTYFDTALKVVAAKNILTYLKTI